MKKESKLLTQGLPIFLTVVIFFVLSFLILFQIIVLNRFTKTDILLQIRWGDILVGLTIYLKTSVDFAIFIGNLMSAYPGWRNRISIEIGTALGNAAGTMIILALWNFFREIEWLLALMIFIASLVLLRLAEDGLEHAKVDMDRYRVWFRTFLFHFDKNLGKLNDKANKVLKYIVPHASMKPKKGLMFWGLFASSFSIPFILGLDDFAGYVPLFSIVNVFGFAIGVFAGHMLLNIALFISPEKTVKAVKQPVISFLGSLVFVGLAIWGFWEVYEILFAH